MSLKNTISMLALFGLATAVFASEEMRTRVAIAVVEDGGEEVRLHLDSEDLGFNLHDMQPGENYAFVDDTGRNVLVTRTEGGLDFSIDGQTISLPAAAGEGEEMVWVGEDGNGDVHVLHDVEVGESNHAGKHAIHVIKQVVKGEE